MSQDSIPNIIFFGETGVGKSSVINMLLGSDEARVDDAACGQTFRTAVYPADIDGKTYSLYDTVGLGEHSGGTVDSTKATGNLYRLVTNLSNSGGVNLLVLVMKRGRLTETIGKNYTLFHHGFCDSKVPIVIVVTGCEDVEPTMDAWWTKNEWCFTQAKISFEGHACVCAYKGAKTGSGDYRNQDLVGCSVGVVKKLLVQYCTSGGWKMQSALWFKRVLGSFINIFRLSKVPAAYTNLYDRLTDVVSVSEAEQIIKELTQHSIPNIIVFGGIGAGKSSVISMILGNVEANADSRRLAQSRQNVIHTGDIHGETYNLHDTVGLGANIRDIDSTIATRSLYHLVGDLSNSGGINLLVYVVRNDKRRGENLLKNYSLIRRVFCDSKVPIVIIITGCENERPTWGSENELSQAGMAFNGHAFVCAIEGKNRDHQEVIRQLVVKHCLPEGWKQKPVGSPQPYVVKRIGLNRVPDVYKGHYKSLKINFSRQEAKSVIEAISSITGQSGG